MKFLPFWISPFSILCNAWLFPMKSFSLSLTWKIFICPLRMKDSFARYNILGCQLFCPRAWIILLHSFSLLGFVLKCLRWFIFVDLCM
jgi:hypothetical protein